MGDDVVVAVVGDDDEMGKVHETDAFQPQHCTHDSRIVVCF